MNPPVVLVLRGSDRFSDLLRHGGCEVLNLEVTRTEPLDDLTDLKKRIAEIGSYDGMFFTSPVAADIFVRELGFLNGKFAGKIYVLGERTKKVFEMAGIEVEYRADVDTARDLVAAFDDDEFRSKRILFIRGDRSMRTIPQILEETAGIDEVIVYRTIDNRLDPATVGGMSKRLDAGEIDWICFFAPSAVDGFVNLFERRGLAGIRSAAIGTTTGQKLKDMGLGPDFVSHRANAEDFAAGLIEFIKSSE